jgi:oligopeptidase B
MKNLFYFTIIAITIISCKSKDMSLDYISIEQPKAAKYPKELSIHGDTRIDNYYWMNDRENQEVIDYLNAENEYLNKVLAHTKVFQNNLFEEMKARIKEDDASVPYKKNGYFYYTRYEKGKEYPIYCRKKETLDNAEEIFFDVNVLAEKHSYYSATGLQVSPDNKWLAFGEDTLSRRIYTLKFKNLETGEIIEDIIPGTSGGYAWANDNKTIFYTQKDETLRPFRAMKHVVGTDYKNDTKIYEDLEGAYYVGCYKSNSGKHILIGSWSTLTTEYSFLDADNPNGKLQVIQPRQRGLEYYVYPSEDHFYIRTNADGAKNFKLMRTEFNKPQKENWVEIIPHRGDVLLEDAETFSDFLVLEERIKGINNIRVIPWNDMDGGHYVNFGEDSYMASTSANYEYNTQIVRLQYTSLTTPNSVFDYNMVSKKLDLKKEQEVLGDFKKENYASERIYAKARDGKEVPISLVYKKGFRRDGSKPLLLYGYGSYGSSMDPYFSSIRLSLLDRGFTYAIAHIRGGEELGRDWYEDGKLLNKKNTFTDFIDCAEFLLQEEYTSKDKLFAMGGSAGGLLMGAVINMRPDLWKGVVAAVPFVDVITTMLDETIPLTTGEFDEWGNPTNEEYYHYMKSYSPYDNVEAKDYPHLLVTTGLHDSQVQYWEPAKWVAKLRELKTDKNMLLLHTNMETGHGGASGRFEALKEYALDYAFLLNLVGINK